MAESEILIFGW